MYELDIDCISIYGIVRCKGFLVRGFFSGGLFGIGWGICGCVWGMLGGLGSKDYYPFSNINF